MFDTNIFGKILKMKSPCDLLIGKYEYFVTHVQRDELEATTSERIRNQLLTVFHGVPQNAIPTESTILGFSRLTLTAI
jgi:hypothetical protein